MRNIITQKPFVNLIDSFVGRLNELIYFVASEVLTISRVCWVRDYSTSALAKEKLEMPDAGFRHVTNIKPISGAITFI